MISFTGLLIVGVGRRRGASAPRARPGCEGAGGGAGDPRRGPGRTGGPGVGASRRGCPGDIGPGPGFPVVHGGLRDRPAAVRPPGPEPRRPGFRSLRGAGSPVRLRAPAGRRGQGWPAGGNHVDGDVARCPGTHSQGCRPDSDVLRPPDHGRRVRWRSSLRLSCSQCFSRLPRRTRRWNWGCSRGSSALPW